MNKDGPTLLSSGVCFLVSHEVSRLSYDNLGGKAVKLKTT